MVEEIFAGLGKCFQADKVTQRQVYYFSVDDVKKTVTLSPDHVDVQDGKTVVDADCVCKTSTEVFLKIWQEGYRPGMQDFMTGTIKSNNPLALKAFLAAFGKGE